MILSLVALELLAARIPSEAPAKNTPALFRGDLVRNSLGFRDYEYPREKPAGHFRILVVGDSFTKGSAVDFDDAYPKRLERLLNTFDEEAGRVFEVLDMGVAGTSTPEQVDLLRRKAPLLQPDLVILGYCLNDAEDWSHRAEILKMRERDHVGFFRAPNGTKGFLYRHSALARLAIHRFFNSQTFSGQIRYYRSLYGEEYSGWQRTRAALQDLGHWSRESQVPVAVMIFPLFSWGLGDAYPFLSVHAALHQALDADGLLTLDLLSRYRFMDRDRLEAVPFRDPHPSEIAHRIAAEALWRFLHEHALVPGVADPNRKRRRLMPPAPGAGAPPVAVSARPSPASSAAISR